MSRASRPGHSRPTAVIVIAPDERSAEIHIEGQRQVVTGLEPRETRRAALDVATGYAARIGLPVLVDARDVNGYWRLVAAPDGVVQAAEQETSEREQAEPPTPSASGRGRGLLVVGAVVLALGMILGAGFVALRFLPGSGDDQQESVDDSTVALDHPAPPGFDDTVVFDHELAPKTLPGLSRDGEMLAFVDPDDRLNLFDAEGEQHWEADLPVASEEMLDDPRFVEYGGESTVLLESSDSLWFWSVESGSSTGVELPEGASPQYAGASVLVRVDEERYLPVDGELVEIEMPSSGAAMLAEGEEVLIAVSNGPWQWIDADGEGEEVTPRRPDEAGELVAVVTALREYVIVRWESLQGDGEFLAFHDSRSGDALGGSEIDPDDLEDVGHRSAPIGTRTVAYGPVIVDTQSGRAVTVPGFVPEMAVDSQVFGELDGRDVGVGADGEPVDVPEGAEIPRGLLGANAIVVHEDHLYAISPQ